MLSFFKKYKAIIIFPLLEIITYMRFKPTDMEMFFMIWIFIPLILLLYVIFNVDTNVPTVTIGTMANDQVTSANLANGVNEALYNRKKSSQIRHFFDKRNLSWVAFIIINIIGYIISMK